MSFLEELTKQQAVLYTQSLHEIKFNKDKIHTIFSSKAPVNLRSKIIVNTFTNVLFLMAVYAQNTALITVDDTNLNHSEMLSSNAVKVVM